MIFNTLRKLFSTEVGDVDNQRQRLESAKDSEPQCMESLIISAINQGIPTAGKMPDDSDTAVSALLTMNNSPESAARMAEANLYLGL